MKDMIVAWVAALGLCGCHPGAPAAGAAAARPLPIGQPGSLYRLPPAAVSGALTSAGRVRLDGRAEPGARVRLASPTGETIYADTGKDGGWRFEMSAPATPRLFGLAMIDKARVIQSEGYIAVTPRGGAAQLRAGAGALVLRTPSVTPAILAVDYDSKGGTVVSGRATPRAALDILVDGARRGRGQAAADGMFSLPLDEPLSFAAHRIEIVDGARHAAAAPRLTPAAALSGGPYRAEETPLGWRIDWMTPGGGLQTTLLLGHDGGAA